ncbi:hypothetical protein OESDEN_04438, partial [Oesophagostomum dentatum]
MSIVCAHGEQVDDFCFMTFNDDLLVTCSRDDAIKIWRLSGEEAVPALECEVNIGQGHVLLDALKPHSTAANIIAAASLGDAYVIDVERKASVITLGGFEDKGQSVDWSEDGKLLAISADKGRQIYVYDVRNGSSPIQNIHAHQGLGRESRVLFCGDRLLSSGFTNKRVQEVHVVEIGKWDKPIHKQEYVSTTGVLMPFYDTDTKLVFLVGKGTNKLFLAEFQNKMPFLSPVYEMSLVEQNLGACMGSKTKVNVMSGEVDTFYQLTKHSILPIPCIVPRRSYRDFHPDLFPDTRGSVAGCSSSEWLAGSDSLYALETTGMKHEVNELVYTVDNAAEKENKMNEPVKEPAKISLAPNGAPATKTPTHKSDPLSTSSPLASPVPSAGPLSNTTTRSVQPHSPAQPPQQPAVLPQPRIRTTVVSSTITVGDGILSES